jgi:quercetin dioxygenase-like cupin family protein
MEVLFRMPIVHATDAAVHELHGSRFTSYAAPARGSQELCAWLLEVPAGSHGAAHTVTREEILFTLRGALRVMLDDQPGELAPGDMLLVPAGSSVRVDNTSSESASAWVTTSVGFEGVLADGSRISPPWVR